MPKVSTDGGTRSFLGPLNSLDDLRNRPELCKFECGAAILSLKRSHHIRRLDLEERKALLEGLRQTPAILSSFVSNIPEDKMDRRRGDGFWTIAEHISHLAQVQPMLIERIRRFLTDGVSVSGKTNSIQIRPYGGSYPVGF
jgi:hypothetical protein